MVHAKIVIVEFGIGVGFMGILKCERNIFFTQNFIEFTLTVRTVALYRFIHHVPAFNASFIAAYNSCDMVFQPLFQYFR